MAASEEILMIEPARCLPSEPDCGPEPYNGSEDLVVDTLSGSPYRYRAGAKRHAFEQSDEPLEGGCEHDGDCYARQVCGECVSRLRVPLGRMCALGYQSELDGAFCGCVEARCRWFTQRRKQRAVSSTKDLTIARPAGPLTDPALLDDARQVFELDLAECYRTRPHLLPATHRFTTAVSKHGRAKTDATGFHPSVKKCVSDAFDSMTQTPGWLPSAFLAYGELRFSGVIEVRMAWVP